MKIVFSILVVLLVIYNPASSQYYYGIVWEKSLTGNIGTPDQYFGSRFILHCMNCLNKNNCIAIGFANLYPNNPSPPDLPYRRIAFRTTDAGKTWLSGTFSIDIVSKYGVLQREYSSHIQSVLLLDSSIAVAVGDSSLVIRTTDGGMTWVKIDNAIPPTPGVGFRCITFSPDRKTGMIVGGQGVISITTDSGITWNTKERLLYSTINSTVLSPSNDVFYIFDGYYSKMFRTFDAGKTWDTLTVYKNWYGSHQQVTADSATEGGVVTAHFITPAVGWLSAVERHKENIPGENTIYRVLSQTKDSGRTWTVRKSEFVGRSDIYYSIDFADAENGIVGGFNGLSLFSADSGFSWYEGPRTAPYNNPNIYAVQYKDPNEGLALVEGSGVEYEIHRFRRVVLTNAEEVQGWGSNPYFWVQTAPNPAVSTVRARLFGLYSIKTREVTAKVYDLMGNVVYDASREATDGNNGAWSDLAFSVEGWTPGVYLLGMQAEGAGFARAFVVGR